VILKGRGEIEGKRKPGVVEEVQYLPTLIHDQVWDGKL
jgi:hypothetical protein